MIGKLRNQLSFRRFTPPELVSGEPRVSFGTGDLSQFLFCRNSVSKGILQYHDGDFFKKSPLLRHLSE